jgi:hypothetical protein
MNAHHFHYWWSSAFLISCHRVSYLNLGNKIQCHFHLGLAAKAEDRNLRSKKKLLKRWNCRCSFYQQSAQTNRHTKYNVPAQNFCGTLQYYGFDRTFSSYLSDRWTVRKRTHTHTHIHIGTPTGAHNHTRVRAHAHTHTHSISTLI